jgi:hypothetical protein
MERCGSGLLRRRLIGWSRIRRFALFVVPEKSKGFIQFWLFAFLRLGAKYPRRAGTVNSLALTLTKWDYFLAALAAIRARKFFSF